MSLYLITIAAKYLYIETSSPRRMREVVRLESSVSYNQPLCFTFWYHMFGSSIGRLGIYAQWGYSYPNNPYIQSTQWLISGNQGNIWHKADVDFDFDMFYENYTVSTTLLRVICLYGLSPHDEHELSLVCESPRLNYVIVIAKQPVYCAMYTRLFAHCFPAFSTLFFWQMSMNVLAGLSDYMIMRIALITSIHQSIL